MFVSYATDMLTVHLLATLDRMSFDHCHTPPQVQNLHCFHKHVHKWFFFSREYKFQFHFKRQDKLFVQNYHHLRCSTIHKLMNRWVMWKPLHVYVDALLHLPTFACVRLLRWDARISVHNVQWQSGDSARGAGVPLGLPQKPLSSFSC